MEHAEVMSGPGAAVVSVKLALSDEARASLEAVRVAQESARLRARRQTVRTRIWFAVLVAATGLAGAALGPRIARLRQARAKAVPAARTSPVALTPAPAPAVPPARAAVPVVAKASADSPRTLEAQPATATGAVPVTVPATATARGADADEACDATSLRHAWRLSPEACVRAFDANPTSAPLALAAAQAHHAKGHLPEAAQWAKRALALNPKAAEAYIIIAHDDRANGRLEDARTAYRRYLEVAPRGWHQPEARAALRAASGSPR